MKIMTLNVNGIRSAVSKGLFDYLEMKQPDIVCFQEIKAVVEQIPVIEFAMMGYHSFWFPAQKKGYSGTGILTKLNPDHVRKGMNNEKYDNEGRFLRVDIDDLTVVSVYHPSGSSGDERQAFKMQWLEDFHTYVRELRKERPLLVIAGDYNICHREIDIHDPVRNKTVSGFLPEERKWIDNFFNDGYVDTFRQINKEPHQYTWWSFRAGAKQKNLGWRIDYNVVTDNLKNNITNAYIDNQGSFSDHCPVILELNI
jgi:exodeoxyribonuclease III